MRISTFVVQTIFVLLLGNIIADDVLDPRPFVVQKEISESKLNDNAHRTIDLGVYSSPTNILINVGLVIQNGTLEEADLNSTFSANNQQDVISVRNLHVIYPNRPAMNYMLQFDFCELQRWTSSSQRFNLLSDLSRQRGTVMSSVYFISKYATFSQDHWMWLEPDFMFAKFTMDLEVNRPENSHNTAIELIFELVAVDKNGPAITDFLQAISLTNQCDGDVDWVNVQADQEDPHRAVMSYKMINSVHWIIWFTSGQKRLYTDKSVAFRATVKTYEDSTIWCETGALYCESTIISQNSTSSMRSVQIALGLSIGIGATVSIGLGIALFVTYRRLKVLEIQVWGDGSLDYRELRRDSLNLPEEDDDY